MHAHIVPHTPAVEQGFGELLADVYSEGASWDAHKARAQSMRDVLRQALGYAYAQSTLRCSTILALQRDKSTAELSVRPFETCKKRWCPMCAWRKSLKQWALFVERLPMLLEKHGPARFIMLTLTVRNCPISELGATVKLMNDGFRRLSNSKTKLGREFPATAWLKALEITFPRPGEAHPHFHVLLAVRPSYFSHGYITQREWVARWRQACKLDYDPVVDVRRVKPMQTHPELAFLGEALGGLREVAKYVTKPGDFNSADAIAALAALRHARFIDGGGWLRGVLRDEQPDEQLELSDVESVAQYWWRAVELRYRRRQTA